MEEELKPNTTEYKNEFARQRYDRINITVRKGEREKIQAHAAKMGESLNAFVKRAMKNQMEQDTRGDKD